mmetsp:Transcript_28885/g.52144  ORF Transcript_28885/g.52144 Transcript_28885/m.52144 type:complete len:95 (-) Transcript_28885:406-690(-)
MQYGLFLMSRNRMQDALNTVDVVAKEAGDNAFTHFNAGMLYFDMKEYDKALVQAHRVIALGFERPELRDKLKSVGRWVDPPAEAASAPASAASQ